MFSNMKQEALDLRMSLSTTGVEWMEAYGAADTPLVSSMLPGFVAATAVSPMIGSRRRWHPMASLIYLSRLVYALFWSPKHFCHCFGRKPFISFYYV